MAESSIEIAYQRSRYFVVQYRDEQVFDVSSFLRGQIEYSLETHVLAVSMLTEAEYVLPIAQLEMLAAVSEQDWQAATSLPQGEAAADDYAALARQGFLLSSADDEESARLRRREESFRSQAWHPCAAFYQTMIKHPDGLKRATEVGADIENIAGHSHQRFEEHIEKHGPPPPEFHCPRGAGPTMALPEGLRDGGLYRALDGRRTVRRFDHDRPLPAADLATVLRYVFGYRGSVRIAEDMRLISKTSPSGGSLHPVEVYPLVLNVEGVDPGLYHYDVQHHGLRQMRSIQRVEGGELAVRIAAGQSYAPAHVLLLLTARFGRNFWKYRNNAKTHSVVLLDAGHLSQSFYLVCSDLGLGSYYIAMDGAFVEELLGLDGIEEGALGLCGFGMPVSSGPDFGLELDRLKPPEGTGAEE